jgi:hypothetical protein
MTSFDNYSNIFPDRAEELIERAAIIEFEGGYTRDQAETSALNMITKKYFDGDGKRAGNVM